MFELVTCVWTIVSAMCGSNAATLADPLVRAATPYSDLCSVTDITTPPPPTDPPSTRHSPPRRSDFRQTDDVSFSGGDASDFNAATSVTHRTHDVIVFVSVVTSFALTSVLLH